MIKLLEWKAKNKKNIAINVSKITSIEEFVYDSGKVVCIIKVQGGDEAFEVPMTYGMVRTKIGLKPT